MQRRDQQRSKDMGGIRSCSAESPGHLALHFPVRLLLKMQAKEMSDQTGDTGY